MEVLSRLPDTVPLRVPWAPLSPLDPFLLSYVIGRVRPRGFFSPAFNPPLRSRAPFVFTIHDLIHMQVPAERSRAKDLYYRTVVRPAARRAHRVLTVSEFSRQRIVDWAGVDPERVVVVGSGVSPAFQPEGPVADLGPPFLLYVGNRKPHKNPRRLLKAFALSKVANDALLAMTGGPDPATTGLLRELGIETRVRFIGNLTDAQLASHYRGARALVIPSLYEGFGLPALEALACGCPVVASNVTALPEVCGDAAVYCAPESVDDMAEQIGKVMGDSELAAGLRRRGPERAARFQWDRCAAAVRSVLDGLAA